MTERPTTSWIRSHLEYVAGCAPVITPAQLEAHTKTRLARVFTLIRARVALGLIRYESNRGRSPCYRTWLQAALDRYDQTGNLDALLDVAFYAMAEFETPSKEGTYYDPNRTERDER
jgi:hypothetical protein